jgi:chloramphenicol-sensitive protein RarD
MLEKNVVFSGVCLFSCLVIWGSSPLYYAMMTTPALELICHRVLWSLISMGFIATWQCGHERILAVGKQPMLVFKLVCAGALITSNWTTLVYAVQTGRTAEASFGYYVAPMLNVMIGRVVFKEKLSWGAVFASCVAVAGVVRIHTRTSTVSKKLSPNHDLN